MGRYLEEGAFFPGTNREGEYRIAEMIDKGSSCAVYLADFTDHEGNVTEHILKEYNPASLHIVRSSDGRLVVKEDEREDFENGLLRFRAGYKRQLAIRRMSELKNSTTNIQEIFEANGTWYIDMTVFHGTVYSRFREETLYQLLRRLRALAQVIGSYHRAGFLHLDIKPDNIFTIPETCELVMLFDFDSVIECSKACFAGGLSYTRDWAAPEQTAPALRRQICEATDLYAVGEILFFKIFDRHSLPEERRPFAEYEFDTEAPIFRDVNPKVFPLLADFLRHTIRASVKGRYWSAEELLNDLDKIIKLADPKGPYLMNSAGVPQPFFIGRDHELAQIHEIFQDNDIVFISGIGGIGKSELAKNYAKTYRNDYGSIIFTTYNGSFQVLINDDSQVHIANFFRYPDEKEQDYFKRKLRKLKELCNSQVLFIIDNLDNSELEDEEQKCLSDILSAGCRFLITTRIREWGYFVFDLDVFSEKADLVKLFFKYYLNNTVRKESSVSEIADGEESAISEIIDYVDGHTLTVELIARQTKAGFLTPAQMLTKLKEHGLSGSGKEKVNSTKDNRQSKKTAFDHMAAVFDIANLSEQEKYVLANMALVPIDGIRGDLFKDCCGLEDFDAVNKLIDCGWLNREDDIIKMHPVIGEITAARCIDKEATQCEELLRNIEKMMVNFAWDCDDDIRIENEVFLNGVANNLVKYDFSSELIAVILVDMPIFMMLDFESGERWALQSHKIFKDLYGDEHPEVAVSLNDLGNFYEKIGRGKEAEQCFLQSCEMCERLYGKVHPAVTECLNNLGMLFLEMRNQEKAEQCLLQSYEIFSSLFNQECSDMATNLNCLEDIYQDFEEEPSRTAKYLNDLGELYSEDGIFEKAEQCLLKSYEIRTILYGEYGSGIAESVNNLGNYYIDVGKLDVAEQYLLLFYKVCRDLYGEEHSHTATALNNLGALYSMMGAMGKAEQYLLRSYEIREKAHEEVQDTAITLEALGMLYNEKNELKLAKKYLKKALEIYRKLYGDDHPEIEFLEEILNKLNHQ